MLARMAAESEEAVAEKGDPVDGESIPEVEVVGEQEGDDLEAEDGGDGVAAEAEEEEGEMEAVEEVKKEEEEEEDPMAEVKEQIKVRARVCVHVIVREAPLTHERRTSKGVTV